MSTDSPDYTKRIALDISGSLTGLEELARRMGGVVPGDIGGKVLNVDGFEGESESWVESSDGDGASATRVTGYVFEGDYAYRLTVGAADLELAAISRSLSHPGATTVALCAMIAWANLTGV